MIPRNPMSSMLTHDVQSMPAHLGHQDLWKSDMARRDAPNHEVGSWAVEQLTQFGAHCGRQENFDRVEQANRFTPELKAFDRYGMRQNDVQFHPADHYLMRLSIENQVASCAWRNPGPGGHVAHAALTYMSVKSRTAYVPNGNDVFPDSHR